MRIFISLLLAFAFCSDAFSQEKDISFLDLRIPEAQYTKEMHEIREKKLVAHKHMAALTLGLTAATILTAVLAKNKVDDDRAARGGRMDKSDADNFNLHVMTAGLTLASYFTTAYFSLSAPKADTTSDTDDVMWHKRLAFVHMPAMIIGPILGLQAINDYKKGQNPSGAAKLHRPIMILGAAALAGAAIVVEF